MLLLTELHVHVCGYVCMCVFIAQIESCYVFLFGLFSPSIFPSLCLGVRSLDFGLDAANMASTALAAAAEEKGLKYYNHEV